MNTPALKLTYFDLDGRGQLTRNILSYANIAFEEDRISFNDWPNLKSDMPLKTLPVMLIDGEHIAVQSIAIARYAAKLANLYPKEDLEALQADMCVDTLHDLFTLGAPIFYFIKDADEKAKAIDVYLSDTIPQLLGGLEAMAHEDHFVSKQLTYADVYMHYIVHDLLQAHIAEFDISIYPKVQSIVNTVAKLTK